MVRRMKESLQGIEEFCQVFLTAAATSLEIKQHIYASPKVAANDYRIDHSTSWVWMRREQLTNIETIQLETSISS